MRTLCIAVGNRLRGDDGVAHRVVDLLEPAAGADFLRAQQLTPEISEEIGRSGNVIIIDADVNGGAPHIEAIVTEARRGSPLAHSMSPAEAVSLASRLFGFKGAALVCHVPGSDFGAGEGLSARAEANARIATQMMSFVLSDLDG